MPDINFTAIFDDLLKKTEDLAKQTGVDYATNAMKDGTALLNDMKTDLETWATELVSGDMNAKDLEFLVKAQKDTATLVALKQAGLAQIRIDTFKNEVFGMLISTLSKLIK